MHRKNRLAVLFIILGLLTLAVTVSAQNTTPNPNANISWPPPVYVLRGEFTIRGSANLPNMTGYFIEFEQLKPDLTPPQPELWLPATLPNASAVQDGILGIWNTATAPDGVYALRLTINVSGSNPVYHVVSPIRIENNPPPFAATPIPAVPTLIPTQANLPTLQPTPTAFDPTPRATAIRNANVRRGDGTNYEIIGALTEGETVQIVGISSLGSGWYLVLLPNGTRGWVAPSVVSVSGNVATVPRVDPPPPPTPTPIPATPTPTSQVNLVAGNFRFDPASPKCNQAFNIYMDVANFGTVTSPSGTIGVTDFRRADGTFQGSTVGAFPPIAPGQTINVGPIPLTISTWYNEEHRLVLVVDQNNLIIETNETDNTREAIYKLEKASCP